MNRPTDPQIHDLLEAWKDGDQKAVRDLVPLLYEELRHNARRCFAGERRDHTLQPTALVSEAYFALMKLRSPDFKNKRALLGYLSEVMKHILIDHARAHKADKRGGDLVRAPLAEALDQALSWHPEDTLAFYNLLDRLRELDPRQTKVVELRLLGFGLREIGEVLGCSKSTVDRELKTAEVWLQAALHET